MVGRPISGVPFPEISSPGGKVSMGTCAWNSVEVTVNSGVGEVKSSVGSGVFEGISMVAREGRVGVPTGNPTRLQADSTRHKKPREIFFKCL